jgi:hypothetical protein
MMRKPSKETVIYIEHSIKDAPSEARHDIYQAHLQDAPGFCVPHIPGQTFL